MTLVIPVGFNSKNLSLLRLSYSKDAKRIGKEAGLLKRASLLSCINIKAWNGWLFEYLSIPSDTVLSKDTGYK